MTTQMESDAPAVSRAKAIILATYWVAPGKLKLYELDMTPSGPRLELDDLVIYFADLKQLDELAERLRSFVLAEHVVEATP